MVVLQLANVRFAQEIGKRTTTLLEAHPGICGLHVDAPATRIATTRKLQPLIFDVRSAKRLLLLITVEVDRGGMDL
jgi:hypothetical protein